MDQSFKSCGEIDYTVLLTSVCFHPDTKQLKVSVSGPRAGVLVKRVVHLRWQQLGEVGVRLSSCRFQSTLHSPRGVPTIDVYWPGK